MAHSDPPSIETAVARVLSSLKAQPRGRRSELARAAGVGESVLRQMEGDWSPRSIRNLIAVERAIDTLTSDQPEARP